MSSLTGSVAVEFLAFRIEFFVDGNSASNVAPSSEPINATRPQTPPGTAPVTKLERAAIAYCMPSSMPGSFGNTCVPILAKNQQPIGQLKIDYLFIRALERKDAPLSMRTTFCRHWKKRKTLEVGHRGMGNSYTKMATARENTIHSLNHAAHRGADYVEFDVQLTKDKVAVIFHDFHVLVSVAKRSTSQLDLSAIACDAERLNATSPIGEFHELAVKDLKLPQLHLLHVDHYKATDLSHRDKLRVTGSPSESPDLRPFPTLTDALKRVDPDTGFNVEVKYPMMMKDGSHECENYFERNDYIDIILNDVLTNGGNRRILFSSFDPDICTLISMKQNKYPVLFLCVGDTTRYVPFLDERSGTSLIAVHFAASTKILGVNFHSEDLLRDPIALQKANHFGLVSFVWGDDLDSAQHIDYFRTKLLVDGIVYDRIGEIVARQNVFTVEREAKNALFNKNASPCGSRRGSVDRASALANALLLNGALETAKSRENSEKDSPTRSNSQRSRRSPGASADRSADASSPHVSSQSPPSRSGEM